MRSSLDKMAQAVAKIGNSLATKGPQLVKRIVAFSQPRLSTFWKYARVELKPPMPSEFPQVAQGFGSLVNGAKTGAWKKVTVKEATVNACVTAEIAFCFFIGECLGRVVEPRRGVVLNGRGGHLPERVTRSALAVVRLFKHLGKLVLVGLGRFRMDDQLPTVFAMTPTGEYV